MRLLHIAAEIDPKFGGVSKAIQTMINSLAASGIDNEVVCLDNPSASFLADLDFPVHAIGPSKSSWCFSPYLLPWLIENYSRFDRVIVHGLWLYHAFAAKKAAKILSSRKKGEIAKQVLPKLYVMPHGMLDPYFQKAAGRKLKAIRNWLYWKVIEAKLVNTAEGLLFTSEPEMVLADKTFSPYAPHKKIVIGLGLENPPVFNVSMRNAFVNKCPEIRDDPFFLFLGRIHEKKGIELLINAYKALVENGKTKMKLVIAGPGLKTEYGKKIIEVVIRNETLKTRIFFAGMLSGDAKWGAIYGCEAFVLPSHQENFGIAVVEALACSRPVLISNQINIWQQIESCKGGLIAADTISGTRSLLDRWIALSAEDKMEMGRRARHCYDKEFAAQIANENLLKELEWDYLANEPTNAGDLELKK